MIATVTFIGILVMVLLIARMGAVALLATGVAEEVARFQALSALTGVGFTTDEAGTVISHPVRRRIVMVLMLVGNAGFATIVATLTISFVTASSGDIYNRVLLAALGIILVALAARSTALEAHVTHLLTAAVNRFTDLELRDYHHLMQLSKEYAITELHISYGDWLADKTLEDLHLPDEGVLVLAVLRASGEFLGAPKGHTEVHPNDMMVLYGRSDVIAELDGRPASWAGDQAHDKAVAEQKALLDALLEAGAHA